MKSEKRNNKSFAEHVYPAPKIAHYRTIWMTFLKKEKYGSVRSPKICVKSHLTGKKGFLKFFGLPSAETSHIAHSKSTVPSFKIYDRYVIKLFSQWSIPEVSDDIKNKDVLIDYRLELFLALGWVASKK